MPDENDLTPESPREDGERDIGEKETDVRARHLGFMESVIDRMNRCAFQTKTWCITIIAAIFVFCLSRNDEVYLIALGVSFVVTIIFAVLDMYYYNLELKYRDFYKDVAQMNITLNYDFQMEFPKKKGDLSDEEKAREETRRKERRKKILTSTPSLILYVTLFALHFILLGLYFVL